MDLRHSEAAPTTGALPLQGSDGQRPRCPSSIPREALDRSWTLVLLACQHGAVLLLQKHSMYLMPVSRIFDVKSVRFTGLLTEHGLWAIPQPLVGSTRLGFCGFFPGWSALTPSVSILALATLSMETGRSRRKSTCSFIIGRVTVGSWGLHEESQSVGDRSSFLPPQLGSSL